MSSVHDACGENIIWARREDDPNRFLPPLEYAGEVMIIEKVDGERIGVETHAYKIHRCDPDKILAWEEYKEKLASVQGTEYTPYAAAREKQNEELWNQVLHVECPRCDAEVDEKCRSLARHLLKTGEIVECRNPHPARVEAFEKWLRSS